MGRAAVRASAAWRPAIVLIAGVDPPKRPPAPPGWWPRLLGQRPGPTEKPNPPFWFVVVHLQLFAQKSRFVLGRLGCLLPWPPAPIPILPEGPKKCEKLVDGVASAGKMLPRKAPLQSFVFGHLTLSQYNCSTPAAAGFGQIKRKELTLGLGERLTAEGATANVKQWSRCSGCSSTSLELTTAAQRDGSVRMKRAFVEAKTKSWRRRLAPLAAITRLASRRGLWNQSLERTRPRAGTRFARLRPDSRRSTLSLAGNWWRHKRGGINLEGVH